MNALEIQQLNQHYGKVAMLTDINLAVQAGESVGLVGMNGMGKTTLIKSMLDFIAITSGTIKLFGKQHQQTRARAGLAFLPEKFLPPYYLTGQQFLAYMAELNQIKLQQSQVASVFTGLDFDLQALTKPVRQYSKGMAQKLGLVACLLSTRPLLLLDEPMSGLDPKARVYLKKALLNLKAAGTTLFFSTHLLADVTSLCDRIIVLHQGQVCFSGSPAECMAEYGQDDLENAYLHCIEAVNVH